MSAPVTATRVRRSTWPIWLLAAPAFVAVWSGWVGMGRLCGFGVVEPLPGIWDGLNLDTSITLPIGMEAYAAYAIRVWLSGDASPQAVAFARRSTIAALSVGALGQVGYHLLTAAGVSHAPWPVTALAAVLPVGVLGMGATLAHLVQQPHHPDPGSTVVAEASTPCATAAKATPSPRNPTGEHRTAPTAAAMRPVATGDTTARVAALLAEDRHLTTAAIADRLDVSGRTARRHRAAALASLDPDETDDDTAEETPAETGAVTADAGSREGAAA